MDDDDGDKIKRDVDSPLKADDHLLDDEFDESEDNDDINDDFGRDLPGMSTHPSKDTDVDATEEYQEENLEDDDTLIEYDLGEEEEDDEEAA